MSDISDADLNFVVDDEQPETPKIEDREDDTLDKGESGIEADDATDEQTDDPEVLEGDKPEEDDEPEEGDEEDEDLDGEDSVIVHLDGGEEVTLEDLKKGYFRQADYTEKTQKLAEEREQSESLRTRYEKQISDAETTLNAVRGFVEHLIPADPPLELAQSNPGEYQYQKALREQALQELNALSQVGGQIDAQKQEAYVQELAQYETQQDAKLVEAMPHLKDPKKRAAFEGSIAGTAEQFGFTSADLEHAKDHRIKLALHYAALGKKAEQNRRNAKSRVAETPKKGRGKVQSRKPTVSTKNREAMQRLKKSGSLADALEIDFD